MIEELKKRVNSNRSRLVEDLHISVGFLAALLEKESIKPEHKQEIQTLPTDEQKVDKLLDILEKSQESCWYNFLECLKKERNDLYDLITGTQQQLLPNETGGQMDVEYGIRAAIKAGKDVIESVEGLYKQAISVYGTFRGATDFKQRNRSLELAIINGCSKELRFSKEYFNSGTWFVSPTLMSLKPGEASILYVASGENDLLSGVTGGLDYSIEGTDGLHLYLAFNNPLLGSYKNFIQVEKNKSAEWAYNNSEDDNFKQLTSYGFHVTCTIRKPNNGSYKMFEYTIMDA